MHNIILIDSKDITGEFFPVGHLTLIKYLKKNKKIKENVKFITRYLDRRDPYSLLLALKEIESKKPIIVGFSTLAANLRDTQSFSKEIKKICPKTCIIAGGVGIQNDEFLSEDTCVDITVEGEGELIFEEIILALLSGGNRYNVRGIAYKKNGKVIKNPCMPQMTSLDHLPLAELLPAHGEMRMFPEWQRGCHFKCAYCCQGTIYPGLRKVPITQMRKALYEAKKNRVTDIYLIGADMNMDKPYMKELVEIFHKLKISNVKTFMRPEFIDEEIIEYAKKAKFKTISVGLQSADISVLHNVNRSLNHKNFEKAMNLLETIKDTKYQIDIILSLPGNNIFKTFNSVAYSVRLTPKQQYSAFSLSVLPGTPLYKERKKFGIKVDYNYHCIESNTQSYLDIVKERIFAWNIMKEKHLLNTT